MLKHFVSVPLMHSSPSQRCDKDHAKHQWSRWWIQQCWHRKRLWILTNLEKICCTISCKCREFSSNVFSRSQDPVVAKVLSKRKTKHNSSIVWCDLQSISCIDGSVTDDIFVAGRTLSFYIADNPGKFILYLYILFGTGFLLLRLCPIKR